METKNLGLDNELFNNILKVFSKNHFAIKTGIKLTSLGPGSLTAELKVSREICNPINKMHGGAIATLLDNCLGICCYTYDRFVVTADLNISYFLPVSEEETVYAEAKVLHSGKKAFFSECSLHNEEGKLVAKASGTFFNAGPVEALN